MESSVELVSDGEGRGEIEVSAAGLDDGSQVGCVSFVESVGGVEEVMEEVNRDDE